MSAFLDQRQGLLLLAAFQAEKLNAMVSAMVLVKLAQTEQMDMTRLSAACNISKAWWLNTVDGLLARGLVERGAGRMDRRKVFVRLAPEGLALVKRVFESIKKQTVDLSLKQWITQAAALIVPNTHGMPKKQQAERMARQLAAAHGPGGDLASMSPKEAVDFMLSHDQWPNVGGEA